MLYKNTGFFLIQSHNTFIIFFYFLPTLLIFLKYVYRCYETNLENSYIIFEDLTMRDYANADKRIGLTVEHYTWVLRKLARWHAATAILREKVTI